MKRLLFIICFLLINSIIFAQEQSKYQEYFDRAMDWAAKDSFRLAESNFREAMRVDPSNARNGLVFSNIGNLQIRMGEKKKAIESYSMALNSMPDLQEALRNRANLYMEMNDENKAFLDYSHLIDLDAKNTDALLYRAYIYVQRKDYSNARKDYMQLLSVLPEHFEGNLGLILLNQKEQRYKEALDKITLFIEKNPHKSLLYAARADIEIDMSKLDLALLDLDEAIRLEPDNADNYVARAQIYAQQHKKSLARKDLDRAVELGIPRLMLNDLYATCK